MSLDSSALGRKQIRGHPDLVVQGVVGDGLGCHAIPRRRRESKLAQGLAVGVVDDDAAVAGGLFARAAVAGHQEGLTRAEDNLVQPGPHVAGQHHGPALRVHVPPALEEAGEVDAPVWVRQQVPHPAARTAGRDFERGQKALPGQVEAPDPLRARRLQVRPGVPLEAAVGRPERGLAEVEHPAARVAEPRAVAFVPAGRRRGIHVHLPAGLPVPWKDSAQRGAAEAEQGRARQEQGDPRADGLQPGAAAGPEAAPQLVERIATSHGELPR